LRIMIVYHGTTDRRAQRICEMGFLPRKPSRRVWFARGRGYAMGRAKTQARRSHSRPLVLTCDLDLQQLKRQLGDGKVRTRNGIIAVDGPVSASVLRSGAHPLDSPSTPKELADWVNALLGLKSYKGVGAGHPGILRLAKWVANRIRERRRRRIRSTELLEMARQWLGEYFEGVRVDPKRLVAFRPAKIHPPAEPPQPRVDPREAEALELLETGGGKQRVRGLTILADLNDPDLFDWCAMYVNDESADVRLAALHTMARCEDGEGGILEPLAESDDKRIRGAAIAALARHADADAGRWFERGLKDPEPCVRLEVANVLGVLDPTAHKKEFQLARHDPNPKVAQLAEKLTAHKGYPKMTGRSDEPVLDGPA